MSYSCEISFKQIEADKVYDFLIKYKCELKKHFKEIAEQNYIYSPICKDRTIPFSDRADLEKISNWDNRDKIIDWAIENRCNFYDNKE